MSTRFPICAHAHFPSHAHFPCGRASQRQQVDSTSFWCRFGRARIATRSSSAPTGPTHAHAPRPAAPKPTAAKGCREPPPVPMPSMQDAFNEIPPNTRWLMLLMALVTVGGNFGAPRAPHAPARGARTARTPRTQRPARPVAASALSVRPFARVRPGSLACRHGASAIHLLRPRACDEVPGASRSYYSTAQAGFTVSHTVCLPRPDPAQTAAFSSPSSVPLIPGPRAARASHRPQLGPE